jgi:glycosyltransferase involved in cell wall biosynthesis
MLNKIDSADKRKKILFLGNKKDVRKNYSLAQAALSLAGFENTELVNPFPITHDQIPKYLNSASVLVVPSLMEGSPNVIKEAMACNCPIVSTDIGDVRWVFGDTRGCYLSTFDVQDFAERIREALEFAEGGCRTNGSKRIEELGLDTETVAKRLYKVYMNVLKKKKT